MLLELCPPQESCDSANSAKAARSRPARRNVLVVTAAHFIVDPTFRPYTE
jgi:hypothetical protein